MKLTEEEKAFVASNRARINLDGKDWSKESFISDLDLLEMSPWKARQILSSYTWDYSILHHGHFKVETEVMKTMQKRVDIWLRTCMGDEVADNLPERNMRVLEEVLELVQACGMTLDEVLHTARYVYDKPPATDIRGEVADVFICLAAHATAHKIDVECETNRKLDQNWQRIEKIREKHNAKKAAGVSVIQNPYGGQHGHNPIT